GQTVACARDLLRTLEPLNSRTLELWNFVTAGLKACTTSAFSVAHRSQKVLVRLRLRHFREQQLHGLDRRQGRQHLAEHPHAIEIFFWNQELFFRVPPLWMSIDGNTRRSGSLRSR